MTTGTALPFVSPSMPPFPLRGVPAHAGKMRTAVIATTDEALGGALAAELGNLRWSVRAAQSAAGMFALLEEQAASVCLVGSSFPDLDARECVAGLEALFPGMPVIVLDGVELGARPAASAVRTEVLHALRRAQDRLDAPAWQGSLPESEIRRRHGAGRGATEKAAQKEEDVAQGEETSRPGLPDGSSLASAAITAEGVAASVAAVLPEFVGSDPRLGEVCRRIELVAARKTAVLIHGATGTGKELVARALHRLSGRAADRFVAVNCAAIPEALMEAELFGHARGAFTGAQGSRVGRIEAAGGGTLFLDEVGELSPAAQSKLLRFLESGVIQRVGENEEVRVDVRVVAATHRKLGAMAREGSFRLDLLHRLSVFLIQTPELAGRTEDINALIDHALVRLGETGRPGKQLNEAARVKLHGHAWPGNVRELQHTVERAWILSGADRIIGAECVDFGEALY